MLKKIFQIEKSSTSTLISSTRIFNSLLTKSTNNPKYTQPTPFISPSGTKFQLVSWIPSKRFTLFRDGVSPFSIVSESNKQTITIGMLSVDVSIIGLFVKCINLGIDPSIMLTFALTSCFASFAYAIQLSNKPEFFLHRPFNQTNFQKTIENHVPKISFDKDGNCFGHVRAWHLCHLKGINYLVALNEIVTTINFKHTLSSSQLTLLQFISDAQEDQGETRQRYPFKYGTFISFYRKNIANIIIDHAIKNPNELTMANPYKVTGHIIGIIADDNGTIKIFDPNYGESFFYDAKTAKINLSKLLAYKYSFDHPHISAFFKISNKQENIKLIETENHYLKLK